jgi:hypothetical protein
MRRIYRKGYSTEEQAKNELKGMVERNELNDDHKPIVDSFYNEYLDITRWLITIEEID